jgi:hypothetical protein
MTTTLSPRCSVTVVFPGFVSPLLQRLHFMTFSSI